MAEITRKQERGNTRRPGGGRGAISFCMIGGEGERIWGGTLAQRARRAFAEHGIRDEIRESDIKTATGPVILLRADAIVDPPLIAALIERPGTALVAENTAGAPVPAAVHAPARQTAAGLALLKTGRGGGFEFARADQLGAGFWKKLRKRQTPYVLLLTPDNRRQVEWRMFMGTYKGATDFVTKYFWPWPAFHLTRALAPLGVTPNMVTALSAVFVVAAYFLFLNAHWWAGLAAAWAMMFLDTVDGKLARVTLTSSKWGDIFDHGIDLVHPPFWYAAWAIGLANTPYALRPAVFWWTLGIILAGYLLQRIMEGVSIRALGLEIHIWRRIDTLFRQITARRNPNVAILTISVVFGRPDAGLIAVACWVALCLVLHGWQLAHALITARRGPITSWMVEQDG